MGAATKQSQVSYPALSFPSAGAAAGGTGWNTDIPRSSPAGIASGLSAGPPEGQGNNPLCHCHTVCMLHVSKIWPFLHKTASTEMVFKWDLYHYFYIYYPISYLHHCHKTGLYYFK